MSDILGGLLLAGIFAAALSDGDSWDDVVGEKFTKETKEIIENGQNSIETIVGAVSGNANSLTDGARVFSKNVQDELSNYRCQAKNIGETVSSLNPKSLYDASRAYMNAVK